MSIRTKGNYYLEFVSSKWVATDHWGEVIVCDDIKESARVYAEANGYQRFT